MTYYCQAKIKPMPDAMQIFSRILKSLEVENASQAAKKLGLAKQSVYDWRENIPSLENLLKVAESGNASLDWLLTGKGEKYLEKPEQNFEELFDTKIQKIVRREILRSAIIVRDTSNDNIEYEVLNANFEPTAKEVLEDVAKRIEEAFRFRSQENGEANALDNSPLYRQIIDGIRNGVFPEHFGRDIHSWKLLTRHLVEWLLFGTGEKTYDRALYAAKVGKDADIEADKQLADKFLQNIKKAVETDKIKERRFEMRQIIREIVREELSLDSVQNEVGERRPAEMMRVKHLGKLHDEIAETDEKRKAG